MSCLDGSLCMEFSGEGDLEENVLHNVGAVRDLEFKWFALWKEINVAYVEQV